MTLFSPRWRNMHVNHGKFYFKSAKFQSTDLLIKIIHVKLQSLIFWVKEKLDAFPLDLNVSEKTFIFHKLKCYIT